MRVFLLNSAAEYGSTGKIVKQIKERLEKAGDKAYLAYGFYDSSQKDTYQIKKGGKIAVLYELLRIRLTGYHGYTSRHATKKLIEKARKFKPDVIHMHNIHSGYLNIPLWFDFLKGFGGTVIWTIHDCWPYTGGCAHYTALGCCKWKEGCHNCQNREAYPKRCCFDRSQFQWNDKKERFCALNRMILVTPSVWLAGEIKKSFLQKYQVKVIPNGIDLQVFQYRNSDIRQRFQIQDKKIVLGVAMSWSRRKGLDDMIRLSSMLDTGYVVILIGVGKRQLHYCNSRKIIPVGRTNNQYELAEFYSAADFFVNPSIEETLGMTTIEAMACGTPVITYNKTAVSEPVGEECGVVAADNSPEEILKAIRLIEKNSVDYRNTCREHVLKHYSSDKCFDEYIRLYREYADRKG